MIRLSINVLTSTIIFLERVSEKTISKYSDLLYLPSIMQIDVNDLYELANSLNYIEVDDDLIKLTNSGSDLIKLSKERFIEQCFRKILHDYIVHSKPIWGYKIPSGRKEAFLFMNRDEQACFYEANLMLSPPTEICVKWWDELSTFFRDVEQENKLDIGRKGEKLSFEYEAKRIGCYPKWISIESNILGYDIQSKMSKESDSQLLIEVKASSSSIENAYFHVTVNEWNVAENADNYIFYVWLLDNDIPSLAKLDVQQIRKHIPSNNANGSWESTKIPFMSFKDFFVEIEGGEI